MKQMIWIFVLDWIEETYLGKDTRSASAVVDCCLFIKDTLAAQRRQLVAKVLP